MDVFRKKTLDGILNEIKANEDGVKGAHGAGLQRNLGVRDLVALGIAAIIGAGIFSTIGNASQAGGPAVALLFVITAVACGFSALCYAEFASSIPISGSAYTYAYASFGEVVAWLIGWALVLEYAVSNMAVAISWSSYFTALLEVFHVHLPAWMTVDYFTAQRASNELTKLLSEGKTLADIAPAMREATEAWQTAPAIGGLRIILDVPVFFIVGLITWIVYWGIQESKIASNIMVAIKLTVVLLVISVGAFYIHPENWVPFMPTGFGGMMSGVGAVFFAYIGFDAVSTTAEECKNPQRDLPRAMIASLLICTILYVMIALVLTGMAHYSRLGVEDPLAFVFGLTDMSPRAKGIMTVIISVSAVVAMASALLAYQLGQPRIWMSMSRDGLLPKVFSNVHPRFRTPSFSTILTGFVVAVPTLFMNLTEVTDLTSIGTLFAFAVVCAGVLRLQGSEQQRRASFKVPYVNAQYFLPLGLVATFAIVLIFSPDSLLNLFRRVADEKGNMQTAWDVFKHHFPDYAFIAISVYLCVEAWKRRFSLIPCLGMLSCLYLMTEIKITGWVQFLVWMAVGLLIYFAYGVRNSKLGAARQ
jgi:amino acid transporter